jgi:hypothetical protein
MRRSSLQLSSGLLAAVAVWLAFGLSVSGQLGSGGGENNLTVTVSLDSGPSPLPPQLNEPVSASLSASVVTPDLTYPCTLGKPTWDWSLTSVQFSSDGVNWGDPASNSCSASVTGSGNKASFQATFSQSGYWLLAVTASVSFTDSCGGSWSGQGVLNLPVIQVPPAGLSLISAKSAICAGGISTDIHQTVLTASLSDSDGTPLYGAVINFVTSDGTLDSSSAVTDFYGEATVTLTSSSNASDPGATPPTVWTASVTATASEANNPASTKVEFQAAPVVLTLSPNNIDLEGTSNLLVNLTWNNLPVSGHTIGWQITNIWDLDGNLVYNGSGSPPSGYGTLTGNSTTTDSDGNCTATFTAGDTAGTIECTASDQSVTLQTSLENPRAAQQANAGGPTASIVPADGQLGTTGDLVPSNRNMGQRHYVSPQSAGNFVLLRAQYANGINFANTFRWIGGEAIPGGPADQRRVSRAATGRTVVQIQRIAGGAIVDTLNVWIVWATITPTNTNAIAVVHGQVTPRVGAAGPGTGVRSGWNFVAAIAPAAIFDTTADIPNLRGASTRPVPGATAVHIVNGNTLAGGANTRWDISRRTRVRLLVPTVNSNDFDRTPAGAIYTNLPNANRIAEDYPADDCVGNDDTHTGDERNDPYNAQAAGGGFPNKPVGSICSIDPPTIPVLVDRAGANNDTVEVRVQFGEFVRLQIGDSGAAGYRNWYRISDFSNWRHHGRLIKAGGAGGTWNNNASVSDATNNGW